MAQSPNSPSSGPSSSSHAHSPVDAAAASCGSSFLGEHHDHHERRTWWVVWLTAAMMIGEVIGGTLYGSMALVADGWHMATHAAALSIAALAYRYARRHSNDPRFAFGTGKVGELAGFASAVTLGFVALLIAWESLQRLLVPHPIHYEQAIALAVLGLAVNLISAKLLDHDHDHNDAHQHEDADRPHGDDHTFEHEHEHEHDHDHAHEHVGHEKHHDTNIRAAYLHVIADALTSVLAIAGLLAARFLGWIWLDPAIGIVGAVVISIWSINLMRTASASLLDASSNQKLVRAITTRLTTAVDSISDIHLWRVGPGHYALIVAIDTRQPLTPAAYKAKLAGLPSLSHITIEVNQG